MKFIYVYLHSCICIYPYRYIYISISIQRSLPVSLFIDRLCLTRAEPTAARASVYVGICRSIWNRAYSRSPTPVYHVTFRPYPIQVGLENVYRDTGVLFVRILIYIYVVYRYRAYVSIYLHLHGYLYPFRFRRNVAVFCLIIGGARTEWSWRIYIDTVISVHLYIYIYPMFCCVLRYLYSYIDLHFVSSNAAGWPLFVCRLCLTRVGLTTPFGLIP